MNRAAPEESSGGPITIQTRARAIWFPMQVVLCKTRYRLPLTRYDSESARDRC